jgi:hypothetical protein
LLAASIGLSALWALKLSVEGHYSDLERDARGSAMSCPRPRTS